MKWLQEMNRQSVGVLPVYLRVYSLVAAKFGDDGHTKLAMIILTVYSFGDFCKCCTFMLSRYYLITRNETYFKISTLI